MAISRRIITDCQKLFARCLLVLFLDSSPNLIVGLPSHPRFNNYNSLDRRDCFIKFKVTTQMSEHSAKSALAKEDEGHYSVKKMLSV